MKITYLIDDCTQIWGGVKAALEAANELQARGHEVCVVSRSAPPDWMALTCAFRQSPNLDPADIPQSDQIVATFWPTVAIALDADRGPVVHYCQGYEGDNPELASWRSRIEQVYRDERTQLVTISPHLQSLLKKKFGRDARLVTYAIDHRTMRPGPARAPHAPIRIGIVGPYAVPWKDIATGVQACSLAARAGLQLQLVRVSNMPRHADETDLCFPVEWHQDVPPQRMGEIYRSLDVFLGTSRGDEEGFFLPAIEAMACGVPCVLTEIPSHQGHGDSQYALFVEPKNPSQMAEALVIAASHAGLREELRTQGFAVASRYRLEVHVSELEQAFGEFTARETAQPAPTMTPRVTPNPRNQRRSIASARPTPSGAGAASGSVTTSAGNAAASSPAASGSRDNPTGNSTAGNATTSVATTIVERVREAATTCADLARLDALEQSVRAELDHRRGLLHYQSGDLEAAERCFTSALRGTTIPAELLNDLAVVHHSLGEFDRAQRELEQALRHDPDHPDVRANLQSVRAALPTPVPLAGVRG